MTSEDIPLKLGVGQNQFHAQWCASSTWPIIGEIDVHA